MELRATDGSSQWASTASDQLLVTVDSPRAPPIPLEELIGEQITAHIAGEV